MRGWPRAPRAGLRCGQRSSPSHLAVMVWRFDPPAPNFQFAEKYNWLGVASYHMGVDGISLPFVILTTALMPLCILASWTVIQKRVKEYMIAFSGARNADWSAPSRRSIWCCSICSSKWPDPDVPDHRRLGRPAPGLCQFQVLPLHAARLGADDCSPLWRCIGMPAPPTYGAAAPRLPARHAEMGVASILASFRGQDAMWPVHTWLPDAHVEAPTAGSSSRRHPAEDGWLWLHPLLAADVSGGEPRLRAADFHAVPSSPSSTLRWWR